MPQFGADQFAFPWTAAENKGSHPLERGEYRFYIGAAAAFAPTDESVVGVRSYHYIRNSVPIDQRTDFAMRVGDADGDELELGNLHGESGKIGIRSSLLYDSTLDSRATNRGHADVRVQHD